MRKLGSNKGKISLRRVRPQIMALTLAGFLFVMQPAPAKAQWVVTDPIYDALAAAQWVWDNLFSSLKIAIDNATKLLAAHMNMQGQQAMIDEMNRGHTMDAAMHISVQASLLKANNLCATVLLTAIESNTQTADALKAALQQAFLWINSAGSAGITAGFVAKECDYGFVDNSATGPFGGNLQGCKSGASQFGNQIGNDNVPSSVTKAEQYPLPKAVLVDKTGTFVWPSASQLSTPVAANGTIPASNEMDTIAAMFYCAMKQPPLPTRMIANHTIGPADLATYRQQKEMAGDIVAANAPCLNEISERIAVGSSAQGNLQDIYKHQWARCQQMNNQGSDCPQNPDPDPASATPATSGDKPANPRIITDAELADCQQNGMSDLRYEHLMACSTSRPEHVNYLNCAGHNGDQEVAAGTKACSDFKEKMNKSDQEFATQMSQLHQIRPAGEANPLAR